MLGAGGLGLALVGAFPLLWMLVTSLKPAGEIFASPPRLWPEQATLENFARLLTETNFVTYFRNSVVVSGATVLTLAVSIGGAYALTRYQFRGRDTVAGLILLTYIFAPILIIIPFYVLVKQLGLVNTRLALVLSYTTFCLPSASGSSAPSCRPSRWSWRRRPWSTAPAGGARCGTWWCRWRCRASSRPASSPSSWAGTTSCSPSSSSPPTSSRPSRWGINDLFNATIVAWGMIMAAGVLITAPAVGSSSRCSATSSRAGAAGGSRGDGGVWLLDPG